MSETDFYAESSADLIALETDPVLNNNDRCM